MVPLQGEARDHFSKFWRAHLRAATDARSVLSIARVYLAAWSPEQLVSLPRGLGTNALASTESLMERAVLASRAELEMSRDDPAHALLEEMALTLAAAAERIRALTSQPPTDLQLLGNLQGLLTERD